MKLSPSILACNFSELASDIKKVSDKVEYLHIDVMDGIFVPNISFGVPIINSIRPLFSNIFDVHLMITDPIKYVEVFSKAGADIITFHVESNSNTMDTINLIHKQNVLAGISVKPNTSISSIVEYLEFVDLVLVMSVEPGFGGQSFMKESLEKISLLKELREKNNYNYEIEVDGGINDKTAPLVKNAGVDVIVAGSYVFKNKNIDIALKSLK